MSKIENDPAVKQEGDDIVVDATTVVNPALATEEKSGDTSESETDGDAFEIVVAGQKPEVIEPEKKETPEWVKALRKDHRAAKEKIVELERKVAAASQPATPEDPGPEPTFADCDHDPKILTQRLREWDAKKAKLETAQAEAAKESTARQQAWQQTLVTYNQHKAELAAKLPEKEGKTGEQRYQEYEATVNLAFSHPTFGATQQGILMSVAQNPALVIAALAQNSKLLDDLAKEHNLARFSAEIGRLETKITVTDRKKPNTPAPDRPIRGGSGTGTGDTQLDKLEAEAARDPKGDRSKIIAYKKAQKERGR